MSPAHSAIPYDGPTTTDHRRSWGAESGAKTLDEVLALDRHLPGQASAQRSDLPRYPGSDDSEYITWARWDALRPMAAGPTL